MSIVQRLTDIKENLPAHVELVAISKTKPESDILEAYGQGQRHFGENKVQDLVEKFEQLPKDINWHFIGHLQSNKVKYIAPFIHLVHAVDSLKLLKMLQKEALKNDRIIPCLIQAKVAKEETKFGMSFSDIKDLLEKKEDYPNVKIVGLMAMATNTSDKQGVRSEFEAVNTFFETLKSDDFKVLSMGMSNDWPLAVEQGSNMIRVGSSIFGPRNY
ncbi:MAG: YggS family pyridoxal phosphate-dependent enzyme [Bacteroidales bacterium]|jgi:pyridoxal phosphate enzyme (YggS family)|nr:YggS family pyridoxal phosphate-dependent enzyme [Bacteroidales bacterium]